LDKPKLADEAAVIEKAKVPMSSSQSYESLFERSGVGPLSGMIVADFGRVLAAPYCTMLLADMGATVIKVESFDGDETRSWMPPVFEETATYYLSINRNKHSIALDLRRDEDLAVAKNLAARADVFVENFKPGGLKRFGLDFQSVSQTNPAVIYASVTGYGTAGGADLPGYDLLIQAASGFMSLTGAPETEPYRAGVAIFDVLTGLHTTIGILAALNHRNATGEGQMVELNLMSSAISSLVNQTGGYALAGAVPSRMGNEHPSIFPYNPFRTRDGELVVTIGNDRQFREFSAAIGLPGLADDPRFATNQGRSVNRDALRPAIQAQMLTRETSKWFADLRLAGLPCAPINNIAEGIAFAQSIGLEPIVTVGSDDVTQPSIRNPTRFSRTPVTYDLVPPALNSSAHLVRAWLSDPEYRHH
jgi:crotonobetainyl-CoA:carnitine CoA-transferase CaiB-like acyl-CoA transferase